MIDTGTQEDAWVSFHHITKTYGTSRGKKVAVDDVCATIGPNASVGIIGPNGAGKSTILRLAAGVTAPDLGRIVRSGRTCAVIELGAGMHPDLTGRENMELTAALYGMSERAVRRQRDEITDFAGLDEVLDRPLRTYSTGMIARLAFSVAASSRPELLLLDEVLSVGDLDFQRQCRERIALLRAEGTTVLLVSHDLDLVADVCERAILLENGRVQLDGPAPVVIRRYLGLPEPPAADRRLVLHPRTTTVASGLVVRADLVCEQIPIAARMRVDIVVRHHPTFLAVGEDLAVIFASATLPVPTASATHVEVPTAGLPPGRYELRCALEAADGTLLASDETPVRVLGPRRTFAIGLEVHGTVDGIPITAVDLSGS